MISKISVLGIILFLVIMILAALTALILIMFLVNNDSIIEKAKQYLADEEIKFQDLMKEMKEKEEECYNNSEKLEPTQTKPELKYVDKCVNCEI